MLERFPNFPQTIDPVKSQTILEQFLELNNNFGVLNENLQDIDANLEQVQEEFATLENEFAETQQKVNELESEIGTLPAQVAQNTNDIAELKQREERQGTIVKVNGQAVDQWTPDTMSTDIATNRENIQQVTQAQASDSLAIVGLQSDNITNKTNISELQGQTSDLNQEMARTLKTPMTRPTTTELVGVDSTGSQVLIPILDLYPVGTIVTNDIDISPASYLGGSWQKLPAGYALWTTTTGAGSTISAGLPNITGSWAAVNQASDSRVGVISSGTGAISTNDSSPISGGGAASMTASYNGYHQQTFNANDGATTKGIYGNSTTVQPPAYKVYAWKRVG